MVTAGFCLFAKRMGCGEVPGGGLDHGEDPIECLKREVDEETGLKVTSVSPAPLYFYTAPRLDLDDFCANVVYGISLENLDFTPSDECEELRFFTASEASKVKLFPNIEKFLQIYKK